MYTYETHKKRRQNSAVALGKALGRPVVNLFADFCAETSIHGFRHITEKRRHWFERLLWVLATGLAIWGALSVSLGQLQRYNENPTVVTLEKDFRSWKFSLPGITLCHRNRVDYKKVPEMIKNYWDVEPGDAKYKYYAKFLDVVANSDILNLTGYEEFADDDSLNIDLYDVVNEILPELISKGLSSVNAQLRWTEVMTECGVCFSTNSMAIGDIATIKTHLNDTKEFPVKCVYTSMNCYLMFEIPAYSRFYVHSPYDILEIATPAIETFPGLTRVVELSVMETSAGRGIKDLSAKRRGCLYADEPVIKGRKIYSTNSCILNCRSNVALKYCGCVPFYYFYEDAPQCTPSGMACLAKVSEKLASNDGVKCTCASQCIYAVYMEDYTTDTVWDNGPFKDSSTVRFALQPPRTRYTREIVFHFQDLVVSFGGAAGLFLGASFISFVEIVYFLMSRIFRSVSDQHEPNDQQKKATKVCNIAVSVSATIGGLQQEDNVVSAAPTHAELSRNHFIPDHIKDSFEMNQVKKLTTVLNTNALNNNFKLYK